MPFTQKVLKSLLPVEGKSLIKHNLENLDYFEEKGFRFKEQEKDNSPKKYSLYKCQQMINYYESYREELENES